MLNRPLSSVFFTAFDFETTGLYPDRDRIIEIGAVKFSLSGEEFRFSGLINPEIEIPARASSVNGIYDSMVNDKPVIGEILPEFLAFISDTVLVAHNIGFDASFLTFHSAEIGAVPEDLVCVDTVVMAKKYFPGLYSYSLENICSNIGINIENAHRAEDDAIACRDLFLRCIDKIPDFRYKEIGYMLKHSGMKKRSLITTYGIEGRN